MIKYFICSKNTLLTDKIDKFIDDKDKVNDAIIQFAKDIGLESERVAYRIFNESFIFTPTENDMLNFKSKIKHLENYVYSLRKNSKEYKEFEKRKKEGLIYKPYLRVADLLGVESIEGTLSGLAKSADISCELIPFKDTYLISISTNEKPKEQFVKELTPTAYYEMKEVAMEEYGRK